MPTGNLHPDEECGSPPLSFADTATKHTEQPSLLFINTLNPKINKDQIVCTVMYVCMFLLCLLGMMFMIMVPF